MATFCAVRLVAATTEVLTEENIVTPAFVCPTEPRVETSPPDGIDVAKLDSLVAAVKISFQ